MPITLDTRSLQALPLPPNATGESPMWHPQEQVLYWCDIPGRALHRWDPREPTPEAAHRSWPFGTEPTCCAPLLDGGLLLAMRDGLWRFDPDHGERQPIDAPAPYDAALQRYNDGKADPQGRFWVGTYNEKGEPGSASLYRWDRSRGLARMAGDISASNGLAWSLDGRTMYWADTRAHVVHAFDFDGQDGSLTSQRVHLRFAPRGPGQPPAAYGGRPDGAAVDSEGAYWVAMYEGARVLRFAPSGELLAMLPLPVSCPTMPCFGGPDLKTLYITTARQGRPADELAREPWAGCVLQLRVDVPGLPANVARG